MPAYMHESAAKQGSLRGAVHRVCKMRAHTPISPAHACTMRAHMCTHAHAHFTCTRTHNTCAHVHTCTRIPAHESTGIGQEHTTHVERNTGARARSLTHAHAHAHAHTHTHMRALQVHDEVILEGPKATVMQAKDLVVQHMAHPWAWAAHSPVRVDEGVHACMCICMLWVTHRLACI